MYFTRISVEANFIINLFPQLASTTVTTQRLASQCRVCSWAKQYVGNHNNRSSLAQTHQNMRKSVTASRRTSCQHLLCDFGCANLGKLRNRSLDANDW